MALSTGLLWHCGTACLASHGTPGPFTWALRRLLKRLACLKVASPMCSPCPAQRGPLHAVACYCVPPLWGGPIVGVTSYERRHAIACKGAEWTQHTSFLPDAYHVSAMQFLGALTYPNHARLDRTAEENKREGMKTYHSIPARPCTPSQSQAHRELSAQRESFGLSTRSTPPQAVIACVNTTCGRFATAEISASARVSLHQIRSKSLGLFGFGLLGLSRV
ncbi:hypothetical protein B0H13DRAFT_1904451 [Mycena leptocephala]|nr:hypothetical protein B0H13DRAFT_1904451 [Mycena leptocephala]